MSHAQIIVVTRKLEFDAGHRLINHEGKCKYYHGHRYVAEISVTAPELDSCGRIIDFSEIKRLVGGWIDKYWDHNMILHQDDPLLYKINKINLASAQEVYIMKDNPTAENMAKELALVSDKLLRPLGMSLQRITLWETPNCFAEVHAFLHGAIE